MTKRSSFSLSSFSLPLCCAVCLALALSAIAPLSAQGVRTNAANSAQKQVVPVQVRQSAGVDSRVDYARLDRLGPWDDRNYRLTAEDVALLRDDQDSSELVPAFYRVEIRRIFRERGEDVRVYPRSAEPRFKTFYGGYLVNGRLYANAERRRDGSYDIYEGNSRPVMEYLIERAGIRSSTGEARVTFPNGAAESAVAINPKNPLIAVAGSNGPGGGQKMHYSTNGGVTWSAVPDDAPDSPLPGGGTCCDPTVAWSSDGTKAYAATLGVNRNYFYRSGDGGQTWTDLPGAAPQRRVLGSASTDKEFLHVDTEPGSPFRDVIYMSWHENNIMKFARSLDFGDTWQPTLSFGSDPEGLGSDITTDIYGHVYLIYPNLDPSALSSSDVRLLKSTDGGASFGSSTIVGLTEATYEFQIPIMYLRKAWIYPSVDSDRTQSPYRGNVYAAWTDTVGPESALKENNHTRIRVAASNDGGASWTVTTPHETVDALTVDRFAQWLGVDDDGVVHVTFYDTRQVPRPQLDENDLALDLYHSKSIDGGLTWSAPDRLTTVSSKRILNGFEWGDYNGLDISGDRLLTIFTDNRAEGAEIGDSVDVYTVERHLSLDFLFADGFESGSFSEWSGIFP